MESVTGSNGQNIDQISNLIDGLKNSFSEDILFAHGMLLSLIKWLFHPATFYFSFMSIITKGFLKHSKILRYIPRCSFNIASYSLLTCMIAQQCNLVLKSLSGGGDVRLYHNTSNKLNSNYLEHPTPPHP